MLKKIEELGENRRLEALNVKELKEFLVKKANTTSLFHFTEELIQNLKKAQKFGNARNYETVLGVLKKFCEGKGKSDLQFREVTYRFLKEFEHHHLSKGNSVNGLSVYLRAIRAIYNKAIKEGIAKQEDYPFRTYANQG